ncbi:MAG: hypothetical protein ISS69_11165 [Phycisphaerae bacterium]|nr:hypothetical protein [Phycisphaerae bacterium]
MSHHDLLAAAADLELHGHVDVDGLAAGVGGTLPRAPMCGRIVGWRGAVAGQQIRGSSSP